MSTCKDCLHIEVCKEYHKMFWGSKSLVDSKIDETEPENCQYFKDRSRLVELPCNLGDEVFYFDTAGRIYTSKITQFIHGSTGLLLDSDVMFNSNLVGKRFFFSREAAEQALKERGENE